MLGSAHPWQWLSLQTQCFSFERLDKILSTAPSLLLLPYPYLRRALWMSTNMCQALRGELSITSHFITRNLGSWTASPSFYRWRDWPNKQNGLRSSEQLNVQVHSPNLWALPLFYVLSALGSRPYSVYWDCLPTVFSLQDELLSQNLDSETNKKHDK